MQKYQGSIRLNYLSKLIIIVIDTQLMHRKSLMFATIILTILSITHTQNICQNCIDPNTFNFTCNNQGCDGFIVYQTQYSNINTILQNINCIGGAKCYYLPDSGMTYSVYTYLFCNYTFPGCMNCDNSQTCKKCMNGFYSNNYDVTLGLYNCQSCQSAIGGCELCTTANGCQQCNPSYLNVGGICFTTQGNVQNKSLKWNKNGSTPTQIVTDVQLLLVLAGIAFIFYKLYKRNSQAKPKPQMEQAKYYQAPQSHNPYPQPYQHNVPQTLPQTNQNQHPHQQIYISQPAQPQPTQ